MLHKWAVLDIETTGLDPNYDEIIDVGFLQFEGTKLIRTFSSLVRSGGDVTLPHFIQKLTSITPKMLEGAPQFSIVLPEILDLYGHEILAHNSSFEKSFLENHFEKIADDNPRESFEDSMFILALMFPQKNGLNLEKFIVEWGIRDDEAHRGLEDSLDLLKVILVAAEYISENLEMHQTLLSLFSRYELESYWPLNFLIITSEDRYEIAKQINFNLEIALDFVREFEKGKTNQILDANPWVKTDFSGENI